MAKKKAKVVARSGRRAKRATTATAPRAAIATRFIKVSSDGHALPASAPEWEGVYDASTGIIHGRRLLPGIASWADSVKKAAAATLCGAPARAPTIRERLSIVDYERHSPALDPTFFDSTETSGWEWTSTTCASSPSGGAWGVDLGNGSSFWDYQSYAGHVRAVRAGQPLGL